MKLKSRTSLNLKPTIKEITIYRLAITILVMVFVVYNFVIYTNPGRTNKEMPMSETALLGETLWQKHNCTSCHQLYGLGGYLGPDLTNVISRKNKGERYVKAMLNSGIKQMPAFNFTETELNQLVEFLSHVDKTGFYPNHESELSTSGWVKLKYKVD